MVQDECWSKGPEEGDSVLITPLPDGRRTPFHLNLDAFDLPSTVDVVAESFAGNIVVVATNRAHGYVSWNLETKVFQYRLDAGKQGPRTVR